MILKRYLRLLFVDSITTISSCVRNKLSATNNNPKAKAILCMTFAMAIHFAGYECARSATLAMFTSKDTGFESPTALPLAVGCVCPFSVLLLFSFTSALKRLGPGRALLQSTLICTFVMAFVAIALFQISKYQYAWGKDVSKGLLFFLFFFQTAYVHFLYTQHMSFVGSVLTPQDGKLWFAPIAGVGSIMSTLSAANVSSFAGKIGLTGLLFSASIAIGFSGVLGRIAYEIAAKNGFDPTHEKIEYEKLKGERLTSEDKKQCESGSAKEVWTLLKRVPSLGALFCEVVLAQSFSSIVNFLFLLKAKNLIVDDIARAGYSGKIYAWINGTSGVLQFFIIPLLTKRVEVRWLWLFPPFIILCFSFIQQYGAPDSMTTISLLFASMKIMDYSFRGVTSEMLYVSLDYESRFIGKEVVNLFAARLGKSGMAVCLSVLSSLWVNSEVELEKFVSSESSVLATLWICATFRLTTLLPPLERARDKIQNGHI